MKRALPVWRVVAFLCACFVAGAGITFALLRDEERESAKVPAPVPVPSAAAPSAPESVALPREDPEEVARRYVRYSIAYRPGDSPKRWRRRLQALLAPGARGGRVDPPRPGSAAHRFEVVGTDLRFRTDIDAEVVVTYAFTRAGQRRQTYVDIALVLQRRGRLWLIAKATALGE